MSSMNKFMRVNIMNQQQAYSVNSNNSFMNFKLKLPVSGLHNPKSQKTSLSYRESHRRGVRNSQEEMYSIKKSIHHCSIQNVQLEVKNKQKKSLYIDTKIFEPFREENRDQKYNYTIHNRAKEDIKKTEMSEFRLKRQAIVKQKGQTDLWAQKRQRSQLQKSPFMYSKSKQCSILKKSLKKYNNFRDTIDFQRSNTKTLQSLSKIKHKFSTNSQLLKELRETTRGDCSYNLRKIKDLNEKYSFLKSINDENSSTFRADQKFDPRKLKTQIQNAAQVETPKFSRKICSGSAIQPQTVFGKPLKTTRNKTQISSQTNISISKYFRAQNSLLGKLKAQNVNEGDRGNYYQGNQEFSDTEASSNSSLYNFFRRETIRNERYQIQERSKSKQKKCQNSHRALIQNRLTADYKTPELSDFHIKKLLGEGQYGSVYLAIHKATGFIIALKKICKRQIKENNMVDQLVSEIKIQSFVEHQNILGIYSFFFDQQHIYLLLEYMEGGNLYQQLQKNKIIDEKSTVKHLKDVAEGLEYLQNNGIVHRDIKPENIVISQGVCKICDFGWSAVCKGRRRTYCGTFDYNAPEMLEGNEYDSSIDLWCLGILTYQLLAGKSPFYNSSKKKTLQNIIQVDNQQIIYPKHFSTQAKDFINDLLKKNPEQRLDITEVKHHPFIMIKAD